MQDFLFDEGLMVAYKDKHYRYNCFLHQKGRQTLFWNRRFDRSYDMRPMAKRFQ